METINETAIRNQAPLPNQRACGARAIHAVKGRLPKGYVGVQIIFDADKGPKINEILGASLSVKEGDKSLVLAPIETAKHHATGKISWMQFWLHDEVLPKSQVMLSYIDGIHGYYYIIPVKDFYDGRQK